MRNHKTNVNKSPRYLTTGHVSKACEVSLVTVKKWIKQGKLKAFRTPGGHFRVAAGEFQRFRTTYGFPAEPTDSPRILIVDDDPGVVSLVSDALRGIRPPLKLESAFDGYEGILRVGTFRPNLLVLDLRSGHPLHPIYALYRIFRVGSPEGAWRAS